MVMQDTDQLGEAWEVLAHFYLMTGTYRHSHQALVTTRSGFEYKPVPPALRKPREAENEQTSPGFCFGTIKVTPEDKLPAPSGPINETKNRAKRRMNKFLKTYAGNEENTTFHRQLKLSPQCYQENTFLPANMTDLPDLKPFTTEEMYLGALELHSSLHNSINVHAAIVKFTLKMLQSVRGGHPTSREGRTWSIRRSASARPFLALKVPWPAVGAWP